MDEIRYQGWVAVFRSGTDYEAEIVRDRLDDSGIPAVVLTQRDHAFNLTQGYLARVLVMVPPDFAAAATDLLAQPPLTDQELARVALAMDPGDVPGEAAEDDGPEEGEES